MQFTSTDDRVAANVRAELARHRKGQQFLADGMGVSLMLISRRMSGQVSFSIAELYQIAKLLNVGINTLIAIDEAAAS